MRINIAIVLWDAAIRKKEYKQNTRWINKLLSRKVVLRTLSLRVSFGHIRNDAELFGFVLLCLKTSSIEMVPRKRHSTLSRATQTIGSNGKKKNYSQKCFKWKRILISACKISEKKQKREKNQFGCVSFVCCVFFFIRSPLRRFNLILRFRFRVYTFLIYYVYLVGIDGPMHLLGANVLFFSSFLYYIRTRSHMRPFSFFSVCISHLDSFESLTPTFRLDSQRAVAVSFLFNNNFYFHIYFFVSVSSSYHHLRHFCLSLYAFSCSNKWRPNIFLNNNPLALVDISFSIARSTRCIRFMSSFRVAFFFLFVGRFLCNRQNIHEIFMHWTPTHNHL